MICQPSTRLPAATLFLILLLSACASKTPIDQVDLMPAPDIYGDGLLNPLPESNPIGQMPYQGIFYATDRRPASEQDSERYYLNDRGQLLRVGLANVQLGEHDFDWDWAREVSMLKSRSEDYPVRISGVDEWGIVGSSVPFWWDLAEISDGDPPPDATGRFAEAIDAQLAWSGHKDVFIYVHGYKVVYENPVLVSAELWHFLGYRGAFIAYAWPSTPSSFAYIKDSDTSVGYARNLRLLLELVAQQTQAERIHIVAYSNGTRLVTRALEQLALMHHGQSAERMFEQLRIKNVILVGSDLDRGVFDSFLADGMLNASGHLSVYLSRHDKALGVSQLLTRRQRLGQMFGDEGGDMTASSPRALREYRDQITAINVSDAEGADSGNGHGYFRSSPWASSDVLAILQYGLTPEERGLVEQEDYPIYTFPPDYLSRLWHSIERVDPEFAEAYRALKARQETQRESAGEQP